MDGGKGAAVHEVLPNEVMVGIFSRIGDWEQLAVCRLVCVDWSIIAKDSSLRYYKRWRKKKDVEEGRFTLSMEKSQFKTSFVVGPSPNCYFSTRPGLLYKWGPIEGEPKINKPEGGKWRPTVREKVMKSVSTRTFAEATSLCYWAERRLVCVGFDSVIYFYAEEEMIEVGLQRLPPTYGGIGALAAVGPKLFVLHTKEGQSVSNREGDYISCMFPSPTSPGSYLLTTIAGYDVKFSSLHHMNGVIFAARTDLVRFTIIDVDTMKVIAEKVGWQATRYPCGAEKMKPHETLLNFLEGKDLRFKTLVPKDDGEELQEGMEKLQGVRCVTQWRNLYVLACEGKPRTIRFMNKDRKLLAPVVSLAVSQLGVWPDGRLAAVVESSKEIVLLSMNL